MNFQYLSDRVFESQMGLPNVAPATEGIEWWTKVKGFKIYEAREANINFEIADNLSYRRSYAEAIPYYETALDYYIRTRDILVNTRKPDFELRNCLGDYDYIESALPIGSSLDRFRKVGASNKNSVVYQQFVLDTPESAAEKSPIKKELLRRLNYRIYICKYNIAVVRYKADGKSTKDINPKDYLDGMKVVEVTMNTKEFNKTFKKDGITEDGYYKNGDFIKNCNDRDLKSALIFFGYARREHAASNFVETKKYLETSKHFLMKYKTNLNKLTYPDRKVQNYIENTRAIDRYLPRGFDENTGISFVGNAEYQMATKVHVVKLKVPIDDLSENAPSDAKKEMQERANVLLYDINAGLKYVEIALSRPGMSRDEINKIYDKVPESDFWEYGFRYINRDSMSMSKWSSLKLHTNTSFEG